MVAVKKIDIDEAVDAENETRKKVEIGHSRLADETTLTAIHG